MPRLGTILLRSGAVSEESVTRALAVQGFAGGRLGTLLIERGSASEDDIGNALSEQHGCPYIPWSVLGAVSGTVHRRAAGEVRDPPLGGSRRARGRVHPDRPAGSREPANPRRALLRHGQENPAGRRARGPSLPGPREVLRRAPHAAFRHPRGKALAADRAVGHQEAASAAARFFDQSARASPGPRLVPRGREPDRRVARARRASRRLGRAASAARHLPTRSPRRSPGKRSRPRPHGSRVLPSAPRGAPELPEKVAPPAPPPGAWRPTPPPASSGPTATERPAAPAGPPGGMPAPAELAAILAAGAGGRDEIFDAVLAALSKRFRKTAVFVARREGVAGWSGAGERIDAREAAPARAFVVGPLDLPEHPDEPVLLPRPAAAAAPAR